jgi:hypothetical protein
MEKRLVEKMDSLDVQSELAHVVHPNPNLVDASEKPVVVTSKNFGYRGRYWCVPESVCLPRETDRLSGWGVWLQGMVIVSNNDTYCKAFLIVSGS